MAQPEPPIFASDRRSWPQGLAAEQTQLESVRNRTFRTDNAQDLYEETAGPKHQGRAGLLFWDHWQK
jgi:hypothetical protein